ncbi:MAG: prolipoprotein diacylglyceryl transferase, partial [Planctomycetales bacterium]|nr:prolipoprotein diacylglyceryl transferase [Planctomycetales bacterium]
MCSELFRIPLQIGGVPLFGAGILLVLWLAAAAWGVLRTSREHGAAAALGAHLPTALLGGLAIYFLPRYFDGGLPIRGYGLLVLCGAIVGIGMAAARAQRRGLPQEAVMSLAVWMFVGGILGARLFYVIEYWDARIRQPTIDGGIDWPATLKTALSYTEGGLVVYGSFLGAMAAFAIFMRRHQLPGLAIADLIAPSLLAGLAFGRIGCLLNGCCYGGPTDDPWGISFPRQNSPTTLSMPYQEQAAQGAFHGLTLAAESSRTPTPYIAAIREASPAAQAGATLGARIARINGVQIETLEQAQAEVFKQFS